MDRQALTRECIARVLSHDLPEFEIYSFTVVEQIKSEHLKHVRLVIINAGSFPMDEPWVARTFRFINASCPEAPITLLSNRDDDDTVAESFRLGVKGFLLTSVYLHVAVAAFRIVLAGGLVCLKMNHGASNIFTDEMVIGSEAGRDTRQLPVTEPCVFDSSSAEVSAVRSLAFTPREVQVLSELRHGHPNKVIARKLNISENTTKLHVRRILSKLHARNRTEAVLLAQRMPLAPHAS